MKLLIVGFSDSVHVARWIENLAELGWDIRIFPSVDSGVTNDQLESVKVYMTFYSSYGNKNRKIKRYGIWVPGYLVSVACRLGLKTIFSKYQEKHLARVIRKFKPDIIHSMEIQAGGYLVNRVKKNYRKSFPKWIATNWGSDIYLFGRLPEHRVEIAEVMTNCDYYSAECRRDIDLGRKFGFSKTALPVFPNTGGYNLSKLRRFRDKYKPSERRVIMLKGYQGWSGRAMVGLRALAKCKGLLQGYELVVYSIQPGSGVDIAARLLADELGIKLTLVPLHTPHQEILKLFARSRIAIGLGMSDAISTMVLESMVMGCFPIQSETSCANEWIENRKTGMIVPPEDPDKVAAAIKIALTNDKLVNQAAKLNWKTAERRLDKKIIRGQVIDFYQKILEEHVNS